MMQDTFVVFPESSLQQYYAIRVLIIISSGYLPNSP